MLSHESNSHQPYTIGFLTGVFDLPHEGHFELLRTAKSRCKQLIVGLTSDARCMQEKRKPVMNYEHRKTILINSKWVDAVVENHGQTKQDMYKQLKFDILFTSDEYYQAKEFTSFEAEFPSIPVVYIPVSSSNLPHRTSRQISQIESDIVLSLRVLSLGISGPLLLINRKDTKIVIKPIHFGWSECVSEWTTNNVYNMPVPPPRNWKKWGFEHNLPNIAGVNAGREVAIQAFIKHQPWNSVMDYRVVYQDKMKTVTEKVVSSSSSSSFFQSDQVVTERRQPFRIVYLYQKYAGIPLAQWIEENEFSLTQADGMELLVRWIQKIKSIIDQDLVPAGIVHGDLHARNICIDEKSPTAPVTLIDWGWCLHASFQLAERERRYYELCLQHDFDWNHFWDALHYDYHDRIWFKTLCQQVQLSYRFDSRYLNLSVDLDQVRPVSPLDSEDDPQFSSECSED